MPFLGIVVLPPVAAPSQTHRRSTISPLPPSPRRLPSPPRPACLGARPVRAAAACCCLFGATAQARCLLVPTGRSASHHPPLSRCCAAVDASAPTRRRARAARRAKRTAAQAASAPPFGRRSCCRRRCCCCRRRCCRWRALCAVRGVPPLPLVRSTTGICLRPARHHQSAIRSAPLVWCSTAHHSRRIAHAMPPEPPASPSPLPRLALCSCGPLRRRCAAPCSALFRRAARHHLFAAPGAVSSTHPSPRTCNSSGAPPARPCEAPITRR